MLLDAIICTHPLLCCLPQVWEVAAQLTGLVGSIAVLRAIESTHHPENIVPTWALLQVCCLCLHHVAVRPSTVMPCNGCVGLQRTLDGGPRTC